MKYPISYKFLLLTLALLVSSCANPINNQTAQNYYRIGVEAENGGNLTLARNNFAKARLNASIGNLGSHSEASYLYEESRVEGRLGNTEKAEEGFTEVVRLIGESGGKANKLLAPALTEHSRILYDTRQYSKAIPLFKNANAALLNEGIVKTDPLGYAVFLDEYATSQSKVGFSAEAAKIRSEASSLRANNPRAKTGFKRIYYNT